MKSICAILIFAILAPSMAFADDGVAHPFFSRKGEGWFWYVDPKDAQPKPPAPPKKEAESASGKPQTAELKPAPFSVEWLRRNLPKLLDKAIDDPSKENVETYLYAQRVTMDKSQRYAEETQKVVAADPLLDENNRIPIAAFTKPFFLRKVQAGKTKALKHIASVAGLWVFFSSTCEYCRPQAATVQQIANKYGMIAKFISMDGHGLPNVKSFVRDSGQAKLLHLTITPTTVLVVPPNNFYIVSQGMMAQDQLADRIILAADSNSLLPKDLSDQVNAYDRGVLSSEDTNRMNIDDPKEWVKQLKERLQVRY